MQNYNWVAYLLIALFAVGLIIVILSDRERSKSDDSEEIPSDTPVVDSPTVYMPPSPPIDTTTSYVPSNGTSTSYVPTDDTNNSYVPTNSASDSSLLSSHCEVSYTNAEPKSTHFSLNEFHCKDGTPVPPEYWGNVQKLMERLEIIRAYVGHKPITVISAYRTPKHNASVGGAKKSKHLCAMAADIKVKGMNPSEVGSAIQELINSGTIPDTGFKAYSTFTHYDTRDYRARW
jgi:hypothetical protein